MCGYMRMISDVVIPPFSSFLLVLLLDHISILLAIDCQSGHSPKVRKLLVVYYYYYSNVRHYY